MLKKLILASTLLNFFLISSAVDKYWRPNLNQNFHDAANWLPVGIPNAGDRVIFDNGGNIDCIISADVSVQGWLQYSNYFETVFVNPGVNVTIGSVGLWMDSGGLFFDSGWVNCDGHFQVVGGGLLSSTTDMYIQGDFEINPAPLGGWFTDAGCTWHFDGAVNTDILQSASLQHIRIAKVSSKIVNCSAGIFLRATETFNWAFGSLSGPGTFEISKYCWVGPSALGGNGPLVFNDHFPGTLVMDGSSIPIDHIRINKPNPADSVYLQSNNVTLNLQSAADSLSIESGHLLVDHPNTYFHQVKTLIDPLGILVASENDLYITEDVYNSGQFHHNNGNLHFSGATYGYWEGNSGVENFHNLFLSKVSNRDIFVETGTQFIVENKLHHNYGFFNGPGAQLSVEDTAYFASTHQEGNIPFEIISSKTSNIIINATANLYNDFQINKDNPSDVVYFETNNSQLILGDNTTDQIDINTGNLMFQNVGTQVDWNTNNVNINPNGTLTAHSGTTYFSGNLTETGGQFSHNMSDWRFDQATYTDVDVSSSIRFYNLRLAKVSNRWVNMAPGDEIIVENNYTSQFGFLHEPTAQLTIEKDAHFLSTHQRGTIPVVFGGSANGVFTCDATGQTHLYMELNKTSAGATLHIESNNPQLIIGSGADEEFFLTRGRLEYQNCGNYADWNYLNTHLLPDGTWQAWTGETRISGNIYETGGNFEHNNGEVNFDEAVYAILNLTQPMRFFDLRLAKVSNRSVTVSTGDMVITENNYISQYGFMHGADAFKVIEKDALFYATHQRGSIPITFGGNGNGVFTCNTTVQTHLHMELDKSDPLAELAIQSDNAQLIIGATADEEFYVTSGILRFQNCGNYVDWNYLNTHLNAGVFRAWSGETRFAANLIEAGGLFEHNMGLFILDHALSSTIDLSQPISFHDLRMAKVSNTSATLATGDEIIVENNYHSQHGFLHGSDAFLSIRKDAWFNNTHQRGSIPVTFNGPGDGIFTCNQVSQTHLHMELNKDNPGATLYVETSNSQLAIGGVADEEFFITQGILAFQNCGNLVDWNYHNTYVEAAGTFRQWLGTTYFADNLFLNGGTWDHNSSLIIFDHAIYSTIDALSGISFHDMRIAKVSSRSLTATAGTEIIVENNYDSQYGFMHGPSAVLKCERDAVIFNTHQRGDIPLKFTGPDNGTLSINNTTQLHADVEVVKDNGAATLTLSSANAALTTGASDDLWTLTEGTVAFDPLLTGVTWRFLNTHVNGGTWVNFSGTTSWGNNLTYNGGIWDHNSGTFNWIDATYAVLDLVQSPHFYDMNIMKVSSRDITLGAGQKMVVENNMNFNFGFAREGEIETWGPVDVFSTWQGGNSQLSFRGNGDQTFDLTSANASYEGVIEIDKPSGNVVLTSILSIEDDFAQLSFVQGHLTSTDPGLYYVRFESAVTTGWSGGNDDSYIVGPIYKYGWGDIYLPTGDNGVFAPCGISNPTNGSTTWIAEYINDDPAVLGFGPNYGIGLDHISECEYWSIVRNTGVAQAQALLSYDTNRCGPIDNPAALRVSVWEPVFWEERGYWADDGYYITSNVLSNWGIMTLGSSTPDNPMDGGGTPCLGDFNGDGQRNTVDLLQLLGGFGCTSGCAHDLDGDDMVNTSDLLIFLGVFGVPC